ncbi:hypothetical protein HPP92_004481 [Vanilla planifolia]|uniref:Uncharacterized protein n=1 Tax=Vanilla planifolia TaxID=51239 RepID=A0A835RXH5_VANPL|nr:hypothetical protein HPP92_004481 [Vanilla planifolia]
MHQAKAERLVSSLPLQLPLLFRSLVRLAEAILRRLRCKDLLSGLLFGGHRGLAGDRCGPTEIGPSDPSATRELPETEGNRWFVFCAPLVFIGGVSGGRRNKFREASKLKAGCLELAGKEKEGYMGSQLKRPNLTRADL